MCETLEKSLHSGWGLKSNILLQSEHSFLRRCQPEEQTHLTDSVWDSFTWTCAEQRYFLVIRATVHVDYVLKVTAVEFQDTPADRQTLEMDYEILMD